MKLNLNMLKILCVYIVYLCYICIWVVLLVRHQSISVQLLPPAGLSDSLTLFYHLLVIILDNENFIDTTCFKSSWSGHVIVHLLSWQ